MIQTVMEIVAVVLLALGGVLIVLAAVGLLRMPDLYLRMSAATKAVTLGAAAVLLAAALHFNDAEVTAQVLATILFLVMTAPLGAHIIARAAYRQDRVALFKGTVRDDLREHAASGEPPPDDRLD